MPTKILWDYMVYWSITGFIFMHDQSLRQTMYMRNMNRLSRLGKLNHFMQDFFRQWHEATKDIEAGGTVDISQMPLIRESNQRLKDNMTNGQFTKQFGLNLAQLETLGCEIVQQSGMAIDPPFKKSLVSVVRQNGFDSIFTNTVPTTRTIEPELDYATS